MFVVPANYFQFVAHMFSAPDAAVAATAYIVRDRSQPESSGLFRLEWLRHDLRTGNGQKISEHGSYGVSGEGDYEDCWKALAAILGKELDNLGRLRLGWREADGTIADPLGEQRPLIIDGTRPQPQ